MSRLADGLLAALHERGVSRRSFLKFSAAMAAALALPPAYASRIAAAVEAAPRLPLVWLRGQDCAGNTTALLHATRPTISDLLLDLLSVDFHDLLMVSSGATAEQALAATMERHPEGYLAVVEGAIPEADGGVFCTLGGRAFRDIVREVCDGAIATIAVGSCAFDGGLPAAGGGSTGAAGAGASVPGGRLVSLPGCPLNVENLTATLVHYLTFRELPPTDLRNRPLFAYGGLVHNQCERRAHFEFGEFVQAWGDEGAQKGWCLYRMGCKGPEAFANCPTARYGGGASWAVKAGHGCVGCTMPAFWDTMSPFYRRLPAPLPVGPGVTADHLGQALVGGVAALTVAHGTAMIARSQWRRVAARRAATAAAAAPAAIMSTDAAPALVMGTAAAAEPGPPPAEAPGTEVP